ncbi:MAG TPA: serpin family protein [Clostridiales bacterium]|nr:serpin family protein [Clostridiales bacterium]
MKEKKIFDAVTDVRDELIEEAKITMYKKKKPMWVIWVAIAACAAIVMGIGLLIPGTGNNNPNSGMLLEVMYPKAYAFEDSDTKRAIREQNPVDENFINSIKEFSYKTGSAILSDNGKNKNYSPLSLFYALGLATSGAKGDTQAELLDFLGVPDIETLTLQSRNLYRTLYRDNEIGKLKIANSIWMENELNGKPIVFKEDFVKQAVENFYASSHSVDFAKEETGKAMAKWIQNQTNGTLSPTIEVDPEQILTIINTVYFYDQWVDRFDKQKTAQSIFYLANGDKEKADFMNQTFSSAGFSRGEGFTRAGLQLKNASQMIFILPDAGVSPYDLLSSSEQMKEIFEGGERLNGEVVWKIPKFNFGSEFSLKDTLGSLGIVSAFRPDADFTGITDHTAFISNVRQETHIAIDEIGVEASAFTRIEYAGAALPNGRADMILNSPFIYGITAQNGTLLFVGVCENPAEN